MVLGGLDDGVEDLDGGRHGLIIEGRSSQTFLNVGHPGALGGRRICEPLPTGLRRDQQLRPGMPWIGCPRCQVGPNEIIGHPLHTLPGQAQPVGYTGHRIGFSSGSRENLPASRGQSVVLSHPLGCIEQLGLESSDRGNQRGEGRRRHET